MDLEPTAEPPALFTTAPGLAAFRRHTRLRRLLTPLAGTPDQPVRRPGHP
jgi:hypothetical protein